MAEDQTMSTAEMASNAGDLTKALQDLQGSIHFVIKKLRPSHVPNNRKKNCTLMMPVRFVKEHGDKIRESVTLRSRISTEPWRVQVTICRLGFQPPRANKPPRPPEIKLGKGWKAFATRNELSVGDALIFELKGVSEFEVHVFGKTVENPTSASSSHAPEKRSIDTELSQRNGKIDSGAGCSSQQHVALERSEGSVDDLSNWVAKKRRVGDEGDLSASLQNSAGMNPHPLELDNVQATSLEISRASQSSQEPAPGNESELNAGSRIVQVKIESRHSERSPPSFIQRLVDYNDHDSAGNTCGARFEVPFSFLEMHGIQLQHHVKLQGIREDSPIRTVTCSENVLKDGEDSTRPALWLGWGDFVRENALRAGQEIVFTLTSESFFVVREVSDIVV